MNSEVKRLSNDSINIFTCIARRTMCGDEQFNKNLTNIINRLFLSYEKNIVIGYDAKSTIKINNYISGTVVSPNLTEIDPFFIREIQKDFNNFIEWINCYIVKRINFNYSSIFNKIKKNDIDPYVKNLSDKVKYNIVNYYKGETITDMLDAIIDECLHDSIFTNVYNRKCNKFINDIFKNTKIQFYNYEMDIGDNDIWTLKTSAKNPISVSKPISFSKYISLNRFAHYNLNYIKSYVSKVYFVHYMHSFYIKLINYLFKSNKEMKYISNDCKGFFSRLMASTFDIENSYSQALDKYYHINKKCINYNSIGISWLDNVGRQIVKDFDSNMTFRKCKKTDMENIRNYFAKRINNQYFNTELMAVYSLYNNYHHDVCSWNDNAIDEKVEFDNKFNDIKMMFSDTWNTIIDRVTDCAIKNVKEIDCSNTNNKVSYEHEFISSYLKALRSTFKQSSIFATINGIKCDNNHIDEDKFKKGIIRDFKNTKSIERIFKKYKLNISEAAIDYSNNLSKLFITLIGGYGSNDTFLNKLYIFDKKYLYKFKNDIFNLIKCFKNTDAQIIAEKWLKSYTNICDSEKGCSPFIVGNSRFVSSSFISDHYTPDIN